MKKAQLHIKKNRGLALSERSESKGFSLIEILVAFSIFIILVMTIGEVSVSSGQQVKNTSNKEKATFLAEEGLEAARSIRDADFANLVDGDYGLSSSGGGWSFSGVSDTTDGFDRVLNISSVNTYQKKVEATVSWADQISQSNSLTLKTYLTNWQAPLNIGLTIDKVVINHGGTKTPADFLPVNLTTQVWDNSVEPPELVSTDIPIIFAPETMNLVDGVYTFLTTDDPDYNLTLSTDCGSGSITLNTGDTKLCTITYEEKATMILPTVETTTPITSITRTTATGGGNVTSDGGATVTARGIVWDTSADPTIALSTKTSNGTGTGSFSSSITSLTCNTLYHVRAYATNSVGTSYGSDVTFTTSACSSITFVGSNSANGTSVTIPTHNVGDLLIMFAYRSNSNTPPTVPAGWTTINASGAANNSSALAYRIATGTDSGTGWSNATQLIVQVYRGVSASPIGNVGTPQFANSKIVTYPAVNLSVTDGSSWVIGSAGAASNSSNVQISPTGMTMRVNQIGTSAEASGHDTNGGVSSWLAQTVTISASNVKWSARTLEIKSQ